MRARTSHARVALMLAEDGSGPLRLNRRYLRREPEDFSTTAETTAWGTLALLSSPLGSSPAAMALTLSVPGSESPQV